MFDDRASIDHQRARGHAAVVLSRTGGLTRLRGLEQSGSAKAFLPRVHQPHPEVVFLNTAGGLTGGDRLDYGLTLGAGGSAVAATQTAERAYASSGGSASLDIALTLGPGAAFDWLPQETILYEASCLERTTRVEMATDARLVLAEMIVLGRTAMGETLVGAQLHDRREIWRAGRPVLVEPLRLNSSSLVPRPALLNGARAFATVALVAPGAEDALGPLRVILPIEGVEAAASAWDGKCVLRLLSGDALALKRAVAAALSVLRGGAPLPRVWQV